jgi:hypothetical protein
MEHKASSYYFIFPFSVIVMAITLALFELTSPTKGAVSYIWPILILAIPFTLLVWNKNRKFNAIIENGILTVKEGDGKTLSANLKDVNKIILRGRPQGFGYRFELQNQNKQVVGSFYNLSELKPLLDDIKANNPTIQVESESHLELLGYRPNESSLVRRFGILFISLLILLVLLGIIFFPNTIHQLFGYK